MVTMIVKVSTNDYDGWRKRFDNGEATRRQHGALSHTIARDAVDASKVVVISKWPNLEKAHSFLEAQRTSIQAVPQAAPPEFMLLEDVITHSY